ncbi:MAG TPA: hypothetical protein PLU30_12270 [Verrucomicrobiae bacterium]|nr:hypothetical protein [Verrucomicrobiae bacterium]
MIRPLPILLAIGLAAPLAIQAQPTLRLDTEGGQPAIHASGYPLLLRLVIANPAAAQVLARNAENRAIRELWQRSGRFENMTPDQVETFNQIHPTLPISIVRFGSAKSPFLKALRVDLLDAHGASVKTAIRALRSQEFRGDTLELDGSRRCVVRYGIDAAAFERLAPGTYRLRATLVVPDGPKEIWRGRAESNALDMELRKDETLLDPPQRRDLLLQSARFALHDQDFARVDGYADALLRLDPLSCDAWVVKGDARVGQQRLAEAREAYEKALECSAARKRMLPPPLDEPPEYIYRRLDNLRKLSGER